MTLTDTETNPFTSTEEPYPSTSTLTVMEQWNAPL
jgi:hypothetical protein